MIPGTRWIPERLALGRFLLLSEQFLLDYFVRRRSENPFWFSSAVEERRDALDGMMNDLMRELKRNLKAFE